ncbi:defective chorion-1 protein, FC125 isoform isoform X2 [Drosophila eugracilis]|uniref:defective chorion-1 protein, FC125 isoform isoform X2 n=1 Tax=Drosophila eugracilis TaxID=29029 RepID=UPI0007E63664|nr:defective chorion-1 protein, FC125 isoform isoform X2 [Drosophila eugracilis]
MRLHSLLPLLALLVVQVAGQSPVTSGDPATDTEKSTSNTTDTRPRAPTQEEILGQMPSITPIRTGNPQMDAFYMMFPALGSLLRWGSLFPAYSILGAIPDNLQPSAAASKVVLVLADDATAKTRVTRQNSAPNPLSQLMNWPALPTDFQIPTVDLGPQVGSFLAPFSQMPGLLGAPAPVPPPAAAPVPPPPVTDADIPVAAPAPQQLSQMPLPPFPFLTPANLDPSTLLGQALPTIPPPNFDILGQMQRQFFPALQQQPAPAGLSAQASDISEVRVRPEMPYSQEAQMAQMKIKSALEKEQENQREQDKDLEQVPLLWFRIPTTHGQYLTEDKTLEDLRVEAKLQAFERQVIAELKMLQKIELMAKQMRSSAAAQNGASPYTISYPLSRTPVHKITRADIQQALRDDYVRRLVNKEAQRKARTTGINSQKINGLKRQAKAQEQTMSKEDIVQIMAYACRMINEKTAGQGVKQRSEIEQQNPTQDVVKLMSHACRLANEESQKITGQGEKERSENQAPIQQNQQQIHQNPIIQQERQMSQNPQIIQTMQQRQWTDDQAKIQHEQQMAQQNPMIMQQRQMMPDPQAIQMMQRTQMAQQNPIMMQQMQQRQWIEDPQMVQQMQQRQWAENQMIQQQQQMPQLNPIMQQQIQMAENPQMMQQRKWSEEPQTVQQMQNRQWAEDLANIQQQRQMMENQQITPQDPTMMKLRQWAQENPQSIPQEMPVMIQQPPMMMQERQMQQQPRESENPGDSQDEMVGEAGPQMPENEGNARHKVDPLGVGGNKRKKSKSKSATPTVINYYYSAPQRPAAQSYGSSYGTTYGGGGYGSNAYGVANPVNSYQSQGYRAAVGNDEVDEMLRQHQTMARTINPKQPGHVGGSERQQSSSNLPKTTTPAPQEQLQQHRVHKSPSPAPSDIEIVNAPSSDPQVGSIFTYDEGLLHPFMGLLPVARPDDPWNRKAYDPHYALYTGGGSYDAYLKDGRHRRDTHIMGQESQHGILTPGMLERLLRIKMDFQRRFPHLYKGMLNHHTNLTRVEVQPPVLGKISKPNVKSRVEDEKDEPVFELGAAERSLFEDEDNDSLEKEPEPEPDDDNDREIEERKESSESRNISNRKDQDDNDIDYFNFDDDDVDD